MLKKFTQTDRHGNMMSKEMMGKFLKKKVIKDRHGNQMAFEFDIPESNVPPVNQVPQYSAEGGDIDNHPGGPKGSDTVPAWLTPGEFVVNKEATDLFGDTIKQMNEVGRQIQDQKGSQEDGLKQVPTYAAEGQPIPGEERQTSVHDLERDPMFQEQLNKMLKKWGGRGQFSKEQLYKIISGESSFKAGVKTPEGTASGLFQFIEDTIDDMRDRNLIPPELLDMNKKFVSKNKKHQNYGKTLKGHITPEDVRAMTPTQQLKLYEGYLTGAGYGGDVHLGAMQGAPGYYKRMAGDNNPDRIIFNKNGTDKEKESIASNKQWVNADGNVTVGSIKAFYDKQAPNVVPQLMASNNQLAKWKELRDGTVPGTQFAGLGLIPGPSEFDGVPSIQAGLNQEIQSTPNVPPGPTSGAQSLPEVSPDTIPTDTALTTQPVPTANFSAGVPNYAANVPMGSSIPRIGSLEPIAGPSSGRIAEVMGNLQPSPDVTVTPGNNQNVTLDISQIPQPPVASMQDADRMMGFNAGPKVPGIPAAPPYIPSITQDMLDERAMKQSAEQAVGNAVYNELPNPAIVPTEQDIMNFSGDIAKYTPEVSGPGRSFKQVVNESFPEEKIISTRSGEKDLTSPYPDKILSKALEQGKDINAPMFFPPDYSVATSPQGISTVPKKETETFRGTINEGVLASPTVGGVKEVNVDKKMQTLNEINDKTSGNNSPSTDDKDKVQDTGNKSSNAEKNKAVGFLQDLFGSLFNKQELKRMAVMYLGSRALGYNHGGSLNFAAKNYLARVDALEASRIKFAHSDEAKNWDNVDEYLKTGDFSVMTPKGVTTYKQGVFEKRYHKKTRKEITVEKVHYGKGDSKQVVWVDVATNKPITEAHYDTTGLYSTNSPERRKVLKDFTESWTKILKAEHEMAFAKNGDRLLSVDKLNLRVAAGEAINEMLDKGASMSQAQAALPLAYRMAIETELAKGKSSVGVNSLKAALKAMYVEQGTGLRNLFLTRPDKRKEKDWDGVSGNKDFVDLIEFEKARQNASLIMRSVPQFANMNPDEAANLYIMNLANIWAGKRKLKNGDLDPENYNDQDRKEHWMKAAANESGFLHFMKAQLIIENNKRLGLNE